ncbi:MAG TPA: adenylate/guanylate cyclase domain-containing protein, partial [Hyphomicrobium sp.]
MMIVDQHGKHVRREGWFATIGQFVSPIRVFFAGISRLGIQGYPPDAQRRLKIVNVFSSLVAATTFIYALQLWMSGD